MAFREVVVEEVQKLDDLLREFVVVRAAAAQSCGRGLIGARGAAQSEVDPVRGEGLEQAVLLGDDERGWLGSITPPAPSRSRVVWAVSRASRTAGLEEDTPGMEWCSVTQ